MCAASFIHSQLSAINNNISPLFIKEWHINNLYSIRDRKSVYLSDEKIASMKSTFICIIKISSDVKDTIVESIYSTSILEAVSSCIANVYEYVQFYRMWIDHLVNYKNVDFYNLTNLKTNNLTYEQTNNLTNNQTNDLTYNQNNNLTYEQANNLNNNQTNDLTNDLTRQIPESIIILPVGKTEIHKSQRSHNLLTMDNSLFFRELRPDDFMD